MTVSLLVGASAAGACSEDTRTTPHDTAVADANDADTAPDSAEVVDTADAVDIDDSADTAVDALVDSDVTDSAEPDIADGDASDASDTSDAAQATGRLRLIPVDTPIDLSSDGDIALLEDLTSADGDLYFYGTLSGALDLKTTVGSPLEDFATGFSDGGRVGALHGSPVKAGLWSEEDGWLDIESPNATGCDNNRGGIWDVSADGTVAVGFFWNGCTTEAFRWSDASGTGVTTPLDILGATAPGRALGPVNRATVISDDGRFAAGFAENVSVDRSPAIWKPDGSGFLLDPTQLDAPGEVLAISADGSMVAGTWGNMGFYWTEAKGVVYTGVPPEGLPSDATFVNAIAADGALLFGASGDQFFGIPAAFVWTEAAGARNLQGILVAHGVQIPEGAVLTNVVGASHDGSILLGSALDALGNPKSFVLELPVSAYGL